MSIAAPEEYVQMPELEVWLCPVHESLDETGALKPLDNCIACLRAERDELRSQLAELRAAINPDGSLTEHRQFIDTARDGAHALEKISEAWAETEKLRSQIVRMNLLE